MKFERLNSYYDRITVLKDLDKNLLKTKDRYKIYLVDDFQARNSSNVNQDFGLFGIHEEFPDIPQDEIWISEKLSPREVEIKVNLAIYLKQLIKENPNMGYYDALDIGFKDEEASTERKSHKKSISLLKKAMLQKIENVTVYLVDGEVVRDYFDVGFHEGGHGFVYDWIPENEIWIEDEIVRTEEREGTIKHEYNEMKLMRDQGMDYEKAHETVAKNEYQQRRNK